MQDQTISGQDPSNENLKDDNKDTTKKVVNNSYLQSQLLIAMPGLDDPYFKQSVTLICQHNEEGCFGLTINNPIKMTVDEVLKQIDIDAEHSIINSAKTKYTQLNKSISPKSMFALRGGPVQVEQGYILHDGQNKWENTLTVTEDISLTASRDILLDIAIGNGPENYLLILGCASWEAGQVEDEIINNSWLNCPIDKKILFETPYEDRWQASADSLGINLYAMSGMSGHD